MLDLNKLQDIIQIYFNKVNTDLSNEYNQPVGRLDKKIIILNKEYVFDKKLFNNELTVENISNNIILNILDFIRDIRNYILKNPYKVRPLGQIYDSYIIKMDDIFLREDEIVLNYTIMVYVDNRYINEFINFFKIDQYEFYSVDKHKSISYK